MTLPWHLYVMALIYILAGSNHFLNSAFYIRLIPPYFPNPKLLNIITGAMEIILGTLLCIPSTSKIAAIGIIGILIAVFPANIFMYQVLNKKMGALRWVLLLRLPFQIVLIIWAYQYSYFIQ
jgi:uncharacterized membrane protein